ncbi:endonuclease/exonuclease/phosphatase family protein [Streptomyces sp. NPDC099088]|uniref:endonuclease/exonuclease/phosphatase family protein n=1 Tax=Streptomyces sp. NPDC099088 TaxID=3366101 RepID=UPI0037F1A3B8
MRAHLIPRRLSICSTAVVAFAGGLVAMPQSASGSELHVHDIQGGSRVSPMAGQAVNDVEGTVTAVRAFGSSRGFWIQDSHPDSDPATSEGMFVYTATTTPGVHTGDLVRVSGTVNEYYPGGVSQGLQSLTQISQATWVVTSSDNAVPDPVALTDNAIPSAYAPDAGGSSIENLHLQPGNYALDFYESLEGMLTQVSDAHVVGATSDHNELWVTAKPSHNTTARGGSLYSSYADPNSARIKIASLIPFAQHPFPVANVGDELSGETAGPMDYDQFGGYTVQASKLGNLDARELTREKTRAANSKAELSVATYNVENLSPQDPAAKFQRLAQAIVSNLASPDIIALEEVQDDNGPVNDSVVSAEATLKKLSDAVSDAGGPEYKWHQIDPADDQDGGQPGGNIRVAFFYNPKRVSFPQVPGGDATTPVTPVTTSNGLGLSVNPGRLDPANPAWNNSRKPLVAQFNFRGRSIFVVANHFNSKGGDQALDGRFQPPARSSEVQRRAQAKTVNSWVKSLTAIDPNAKVIVVGDLNDYSFSSTLEDLGKEGVLVDLVRQLPHNEQYGYVFNGNSQTLDHILASPAINESDYDIVHINSEFADQASDHDPQVVRID